MYRERGDFPERKVRVMFFIAPRLTRKEVSFINYANYSYLKRTSKDYDHFHGSFGLTIDQPVAHGHDFQSYVKWQNNSKYIMRIVYSTCIIDGTDYSFITPMNLEHRKNKDDYRGHPMFLECILEDVIYTNIMIEDTNIGPDMEVIKTPWFIVAGGIVRKLVWIRHNGKFNFGCTPCDDLSGIKLSSGIINSMYQNESKKYAMITADDTCNNAVEYLRSKSPYTADLVLDYLVDRDILFACGDVAALKKFMDNEHFVVYHKSRFTSRSNSGELFYGWRNSDTRTELVNSVSIGIGNWIDNQCADAIVNLIPILIQHGYVDEISTAICKSADPGYVNIMFGKYINFDGRHITKEYKLFGEATLINPIDYCLSSGNVDKAISYLKYHNMLGPMMVRHLIESQSQPLIKWLIETKEYEKFFTEYKSWAMNSITTPGLMKVYLTKIRATVKDLGSRNIADLFYHLIRSVNREELIDVLAAIPDYPHDKVSDNIRDRLCDILIREASDSYNRLYPKYEYSGIWGDEKKTESEEDKKRKDPNVILAKFDEIWQRYGSDVRVLYRVENGTAAGVCANYINNISAHGKLLTFIVKKYNIREIMIVVTSCKRLNCTQVNIQRIKRWVADFKW